MSNQKLRRRDRAWDAVKASSKTVGKGFQKVEPMLKKVKYIVNPRNAMLGIFFTMLLTLSLSMKVDVIPEVPPIEGLPGWFGNISVTLLLAAMVQESTYRLFSMIPGSEWFNTYIGSPLALTDTYGCAVGVAICHSVEINTKGWKCLFGSACCSGYLVGAHRVCPTNPILTASRVAASPFEVATESA